MHPLPIGLPDGYTEMAGNFGDANIIRNFSRKLKPFHNRTTLIYLNFRPITWPKEREWALDYFYRNFGNDSDATFKWDVLKKPYHVDESLDYGLTLRELENSQFVVSPRGRLCFLKYQVFES